MVLPLAVSFIMKVVGIIWVLVAITLILIVMLQKGRGGGLSAAFGGGAGSLLGTKTGDFLTWVTISLAALFIILSVVLAKYFRPSISEELAAPSQTQTQPLQPEGTTDDATQPPAPASPQE